MAKNITYAGRGIWKVNKLLLSNAAEVAYFAHYFGLKADEVPGSDEKIPGKQKDATSLKTYKQVNNFTYKDFSDDTVAFLKSGGGSIADFINYLNNDSKDDANDGLNNSKRGNKTDAEKLKLQYERFKKSGGAPEAPDDIDFTFTDADGKVISFNDIIADMLDPNRHGKFVNSKSFNINNETGNVVHDNKNKFETNRSNQYMKENDKNLMYELTMGGLLGFPFGDVLESFNVQKVPSIYEFLKD